MIDEQGIHKLINWLIDSHRKVEKKGKMKNEKIASGTAGRRN